MTLLNLHSQKNIGNWVIASWLILSVGGCKTVEESPDVADPEVRPDGIAVTESESVETGLTPNLLYDILVAAVAAQRDQTETALDALSRAAYQSRDRRLIAEAIQLAMEKGDYQKAMDLAQLLNDIEPENFRVMLSLATAQFGLGQKENALILLSELAAKQDRSRIYVFHEIAALLSLQDKETILDDFLAIVSTRPENAGQAITATILAFRLERPDEFIKLVNHTLELEPDWEAPAVLKLTYLSGHDPELMDQFARQHLRQFAQHERFRLQFARSLLQNENPDSALEQFLLVLESNPDSEDALYSAGVLYLDKELPDKSRPLLEHYLEVDHSNDQVRIYLADIEEKAGNFARAINYLHGVSSDRYYIDAQIKLGRILAEKDGVESGIRHLDQIDTGNEEERTRIILEQDFLFRDRGMLTRSKKILDDGLGRFPENPDLLYNRGLLHAELDMLSLHEIDMRKLIELQPENAHAYNALGYTLADKTDRLDEAIELIERANELLPDNPFILDSMGWVHFRLGNNDTAIKFLRRALDSRQDAEIAAHLGEVLWITGRYDEAKKIWEQGIEWSPDNPVLKDTIDRLSIEPSNNVSLYMIKLINVMPKAPLTVVSA